MIQSDSVLAPPEEGEQPFISVDPHIQDYLNKVQDANPVLSLLMTMGVEADEAQRKSLAEALNKKETLNLSQLDLPTLALYNLFIALRSNTTIKNRAPWSIRTRIDAANNPFSWYIKREAIPLPSFSVIRAGGCSPPQFGRGFVSWMIRSLLKPGSW